MARAHLGLIITGTYFSSDLLHHQWSVALSGAFKVVASAAVDTGWSCTPVCWNLGRAQSAQEEAHDRGRASP